MQSRFHNYSFGNTLLIQLQTHGQATRVAGFHAWRKFGRHVRKGEKAIWILAPMTRKVRDDEHRDHDHAEGARVLLGFKPVTVFDLAQTDGEPLPEIATRLQGDDPLGVYGDLERVADAMGYRVEDADFDGGKNGDCNFANKRIRVRAGNAPAQRVKTLAHELAHALLHEGFTDRALAELEAESVAYIVCASQGIESDDYSFGYVAGRSGNHEPLTESGVRQLIRDAGLRAGLRRSIKPQVLRHSWITEILRQGMPPLQLSLVAGCALQVVQDHYEHLNQDDAYESMIKALTARDARR
jgi:hypothetical protein